MAGPITDADRIAAEGVLIPTRRGPLRLMYGMRGLRKLEDTYGGITELQEAMEALLASLTETGKGKAFGPLCDIIVPGLLHLGLTEDEALDCLLPRHVQLYTRAMETAMQEAFPDAEAPLDGVGNVPAQVPAAGSPGQSGTTSPPAATAEVTPDSGA